MTSQNFWQMATISQSLLQLHYGPPKTRSFCCKPVNFVLFTPLPNTVSLLVPQHKNHQKFHLHYHSFCEILGTTVHNHLYQNYIPQQHYHKKFQWQLSVAEIYHAMTLPWAHHDKVMSRISSLLFCSYNCTVLCELQLLCYKKPYFSTGTWFESTQVTTVVSFINTSHINANSCWMYGAR